MVTTNQSRRRAAKGQVVTWLLAVAFGVEGIGFGITSYRNGSPHSGAFMVVISILLLLFNTGMIARRLRRLWFTLSASDDAGSDHE